MQAFFTHVGHELTSSALSSHPKCMYPPLGGVPVCLHMWVAQPSSTLHPLLAYQTSNAAHCTTAEA
jgi:hypothetical protein